MLSPVSYWLCFDVSIRSQQATMDQESATEEHFVATITEDHEACWGCGLRLLLTSYSPVFKCGWCGAITNHNITSREPDNVCFARWRRLSDQFFVTFLILFMLFVIGTGFWAVYPVVFSISYFYGGFHSIVTTILSVSTIYTFFLAAFRSAGEPTNILWGSYPVVGKGDLENYTFCIYCAKPKPPRTHHCRSCRMCILDMDHHCPFIGNCVGAANHRYFIAFLISAVISCAYVSMMTLYAGFHVWPPLPPGILVSPGFNRTVTTRVAKQIITAFVSSALLLSARGFVLIYLAFASVSVEIGLSVLLWQQLYYVYEGSTYLNHISSQNAGDGERGCQNLLRFFGCPYFVFRFVLGPAGAAKLQETSSSKLL